MTQKKIIHAPNKKLKIVSKAIKKPNKRAASLIRNLKDTLVPEGKPIGVGLAAPQIGINHRAFVVNLETPSSIPVSHRNQKEEEVQISYELREFINPEIISMSKKTNWQVLDKEDWYFEACLSIVNERGFVYGHVERPWEVKVKYQTLKDDNKFAERTDTFEGANAIYIQHEYDHLDGILFTERVSTQKGKLYQAGKEGYEEIIL